MKQTLRNPVTIGNHKVGPGQPTFIIGEIGINHNGSVEIAKQLIDLAANVGCQAVKFQKRTVPVVYTAEELAKPRTFDRSFIDHALARSKEYLYDVLSDDARERLSKDPEATTNGDLKYALEFSIPEYRDIDAYCKRKGILWSISPWDVGSVRVMSEFDLPFFKIASASLTDRALLEAMRDTGKPVILSTGGSTMDQVQTAVSILGGRPVLLHCVSTYPARDEHLNLRGITTLQAEFPELVVGYSGHENGSTIAVCAVAMGACVVERHITVDRSLPGSDQVASLEPHRLGLMVANIRRLAVAMGDGEKRVIPEEAEVMKKLRRVTDF